MPASLRIAPGEWLERQLAVELGVSRPVLSGHRRDKMVKGEDWRYEREVILTGSGVRKVCVELGVEEPGRPEEGEGLVVECRFRNPRIVELEDGIRVSVRSSENFRRGMSVKWRREGETIVLRGRCPRFPGRW